MNCRNSVKSVLSVSSELVALAIPKSIIFGHWPPVRNGDEHVRRFEIPVNDPLLMRMLHSVTDLQE